VARFPGRLKLKSLSISAKRSQNGESSEAALVTVVNALSPALVEVSEKKVVAISSMPLVS
jgi:hypothetical protein